MSLVARLFIVTALAVPAAAAAQSPSPTLPSDTLQANYAPKPAAGPTPELAPSLPSDTLEAGAPIAPDSLSGEMRRDWDQDQNSDLWKVDEQYESPRVRLS